MYQHIKHMYKNSNVWLLVIISIVIFNIVNRSPIDCASSDSKWTLLTTQSIIENNTLQLNKYIGTKGSYTIKKGDKLGYSIDAIDGNLYSLFPLGSSLSSLPFVWVETQIFDKYMKIHSQNRLVQKEIAAFVAVGIFILLYLIASFYISSKWSILVATLFWLGTSLSSTLGAGLWSHTFAILYAFISIYLVLKIIKEDRDGYWIFLGFTLFMAYLTRPTMSLLSVTLIIYLFFNHKKAVALKSSLLVFLFLGLFVLYSLSEFNQILPNYYMPKRLSGGDFGLALMANTFSPSRGLFVFSPFLLLFFIGFKDLYRVFRENITLLIILIWIIVHLIIISKFPHWSGGWCYGSRFMSDVLPAIYLIFIILLSYIFKTGNIKKRIVVSIFLILSISFSIYSNAIMGLFSNNCAVLWNKFPTRDYELYFDWKYPQFLHTDNMHDRRLVKYKMKIIKSLPIDKEIKSNNENLIFVKWILQKDKALSIGKKSKIIFKVDKQDIKKGKLKLNFSTFGKQRVTLYLNDHILNGKVVNSKPDKMTYWKDIDMVYDFKLDDMLDGKNTLLFILPDASVPGGGNPNELSIILKTLRVE